MNEFNKKLDEAINEGGSFWLKMSTTPQFQIFYGVKFSDMKSDCNHKNRNCQGIMCRLPQNTAGFCTAESCPRPVMKIKKTRNNIEFEMLTTYNDKREPITPWSN